MNRDDRNMCNGCWRMIAVNKTKYFAVQTNAFVKISLCYKCVESLNFNFSLEKQCTFCKVTRPISLFVRYRASPDKKSYWCNKCKRENNVIWVNQNREAFNIQRRERMKYWQQKPEEKIKAKARNVVNLAIKKGKIIRQNCEVCGITNTHAHHEDYNKPLQVQWLCPLHHKEKHRV